VACGGFAISIELTVRLEIPEETAADVGITPTFAPALPPTRGDPLLQRSAT
jgi:hypothetical protein